MSPGCNPMYPQVKVQLQLPLLFWPERARWMWHKKWTLPKLHVQVTSNGKPVGGGWAAAGPIPGGEPPVYVVVSAGTLCDGSDGVGGSLTDQGLGGGECQRRLVAGETTFSSLLFKHTSFNCGSRPFHLVVTVLAPAHHPLAVRPACRKWRLGMLGRALAWAAPRRPLLEPSTSPSLLSYPPQPLNSEPEPEPKPKPEPAALSPRRSQRWPAVRRSRLRTQARRAGAAPRRSRWWRWRACARARSSSTRASAPRASGPTPTPPTSGWRSGSAAPCRTSRSRRRRCRLDSRRRLAPAGS